MPWYNSPALLELLETIEIDTTAELPARFQVQLVIRPQTSELHDYRGYAGTLLSGSFSKGERVHVYPTDRASRIVRIEKHQQEVETAHANEPVVLHLEDDLDISRGSSLCATKHLPDFDTLFEATICWMDNKAFQPGQKFLLQHNSFRTKAIIKSLDGKVNIQSGKVELHEGGLELNEFGQVWIKTAEPLAHDSFAVNKRTGAFILINEYTNNTVAAGVIH
jgi:sulfate adenylyltransferase subunit 1